ncbi:hypothetical protein GF323_00995 [Candidatus Woesearchaeota archaeon]|nr:hypothetical protein [Candidatus Woesearchaeota archaeon]
MKIHGIAYILVGAFIAGASYYIMHVNENIGMQKFMLFIWTGAAFIAVGLFKILFLRGKKPKLARENFPHHRPGHPQHQQAVQHQGSRLVKFCSKCGSAARHFDNFCFKCGSRMFHRK